MVPVTVPETPVQDEQPQTHTNGDSWHESPGDAESTLLRKVQQSPTVKEFQLANISHAIRESRTLLKFQPQHVPNQMVLSSLSGPDKIACPPYVLFCDPVGALVAAYYLGPKVAGHTGMVHGGLLLTLLDECMGRACFPVLTGKTAVTAKIEVAFKKPVPVGSVIFVKAWTENVEGRKAQVKASILLSGPDEDHLCAESSALFIEPRHAAQMDILI